MLSCESRDGSIHEISDIEYSGGGISGLCLAVALRKYSDIEIHVYEAAERFKEIGAGVMIWTRTWTILELLGLSREFSKIAHAPPDGTLGQRIQLSLSASTDVFVDVGVGFDYRKSDQPSEGFRFHLVEVPRELFYNSKRNNNI